MKTAKDIPHSNIAISISGDSTISKLIGYLDTANAKDAIVQTDGRYLLLSHFLLLTSRQYAQAAKAKHFTVPISEVKQNEVLGDVARKFLDGDTQILPVVDDGKLVKIIDVYDLLNLLKDEPELNTSITPLIDKLQTIGERVSLGEALHIMHFHKLKELIVEDAGEITGTLPSINILKKYVLQHTAERQHGERPNTPDNTHQTELKNLKNISVNNFMDQKQNEIKEDENLSTAAEIFSKTKAPTLIVKDALNETVGLLKLDLCLKKIVDILSPSVENIFFQGLDELQLDDMLLENIYEVTRGYAEKMQYHFHNEFDMKVHVKEHQREGEKSRYQVFSKLTYPGATISAEGDDWEVMTAIRKSLEKLKAQIKNKYKDRHEAHPEYDYDISSA